MPRLMGVCSPRSGRPADLAMCAQLRTTDTAALRSRTACRMWTTFRRRSVQARSPTTAAAPFTAALYEPGFCIHVVARLCSVDQRSAWWHNLKDRLVIAQREHVDAVAQRAAVHCQTVDARAARPVEECGGYSSFLCWCWPLDAADPAHSPGVYCSDLLQQTSTASALTMPPSADVFSSFDTLGTQR
jgi:hypothetical protein